LEPLMPPPSLGVPLRARLSWTRKGADAFALIGNAVTAKRARDASRRVLGIPRLEPRPNGPLQLLDDLIGNLVINIRSHCLFLSLAYGFAMTASVPLSSFRSSSTDLCKRSSAG